MPRKPLIRCLSGLAAGLAMIAAAVWPWGAASLPVHRSHEVHIEVRIRGGHAPYRLYVTGPAGSSVTELLRHPQDPAHFDLWVLRPPDARWIGVLVADERGQRCGAHVKTQSEGATLAHLEFHRAT